MKINPNRLWYVVLALGWLFDFLFWEKEPGINFAIFAILCLLGGFYILFADGHRPGRRALFLLPLIVFFAVVSFLRREPMTLFLAFIFTLFSMSVLTVTYLGGRWLEYTVLDYFDRFMRLLGSMIGRPLIFNSETRKPGSGASDKSGSAFWPVVRGLVIALPVVLIFASLLSSADVVFSQKLDDFVELFNLEKLPEYIFRLVLILFGAYALAGVILHAASQSGDEKLTGEGKPAAPALLGFTESSIVLGSVAILFAAFVAIQFRYFFGGGANIHIDGFTYSEYARRGFGELVAVAFFTLLLLFGLSALTRRETESQRRAFSVLGAGLVALVLVMLVSAFQRLTLYEAAYGFSRLRTYTHVVLVWIALLLIATIVLEALRRERAFGIAAVLAAFGFAITLSVLNVDAFIVRQNIQRELQREAQAVTESGRSELLDAAYFVELSDDAVPALAQAYQTPSTPVSVKDALGAALACIRYNRDQDNDELAWQSFHLSRYQADRALASIKTGLDEYKITDKEWPPTALTPEGKEFSCVSYNFD
jgi:hypothetical protein